MDDGRAAVCAAFRESIGAAEGPGREARGFGRPHDARTNFRDESVATSKKSSGSGHRLTKNIIQYSDTDAPKNDYPRKIVSPTRPSSCCTDANKIDVGSVREVEALSSVIACARSVATPSNILPVGRVDELRAQGLPRATEVHAPVVALRVACHGPTRDRRAENVLEKAVRVLAAFSSVSSSEDQRRPRTTKPNRSEPSRMPPRISRG